MVFSSAVFVFGFMPLLLFLYFLAEPKYRNYILLIFSLIFYGWGGVNYLLLMLAVVMSDYVFAIAIAQIKTQKIRKLFVVLSVVVNLGVLGYYKYTNFFIENINHFIKNLICQYILLFRIFNCQQCTRMSCTDHIINYHLLYTLT